MYAKIAILARRKQSSPSSISCNPAKLPATCVRPSFPTCFLANTCRILMATLKKSSAIAHCMSYIYSIDSFALWNRLKRKRKATPMAWKESRRRLRRYVLALLALSSMATFLSLHTSVLGLQGLQRCWQESRRCGEFRHDEVSAPWHTCV